MGVHAKALSVYVPRALAPLIEMRAEDEGFKSQSAYLLSLILFDLIAKCRHKLTAKMANASPVMMDKIVAQIVDDFHNEPRKSSKWLQHRIEELIEDK